MKKIIGVVLIGFAVASLSAFAAELSDQDRAELRQRAQELQNQRERNPDFQPGESRATAQPSDMTHHRSQRAVKTHASAKGGKETLSHKAERKARSLKNLPGALLRK